MILFIVYSKDNQSSYSWEEDDVYFLFLFPRSIFFKVLSGFSAYNLIIILVFASFYSHLNLNKLKMVSKYSKFKYFYRCYVNRVSIYHFNHFGLNFIQEMLNLFCSIQCNLLHLFFNWFWLYILTFIYSLFIFHFYNFYSFIISQYIILKNQIIQWIYN